MSNFALIGAAGYIAPRHLKAIRDTGNKLVAAIDPHDSVGLLDQFSFDTRFFTEIERFDRHLEKLRRGPDADQNRVHWVSICSPNYLHDAHCRLALRVGADVICEKPLVINPWNLDQLEQIEEETGQNIYNVLQLRVHRTREIYTLISKKNLTQQSVKSFSPTSPRVVPGITPPGKAYRINPVVLPPILASISSTW